MNPQYTDLEFKNAKSRQKLPLLCKNCNKVFYITKNNIQLSTSPSSLGNRNFCSRKCSGLYNTKTNSQEIKCLECGKIKKVIKSEYKRSKNKRFFCNHICKNKWNRKNSK